MLRLLAAELVLKHGSLVWPLTTSTTQQPRVALVSRKFGFQISVYRRRHLHLPLWLRLSHHEILGTTRLRRVPVALHQAYEEIFLLSRLGCALGLSSATALAPSMLPLGQHLVQHLLRPS